MRVLIRTPIHLLKLEKKIQNMFVWFILFNRPLPDLPHNLEANV